MEKELQLPKSVCISIPAYSGTIPVETAIHLAQAVSKLRRLGVTVVMQTERECGLVEVTRNKLVNVFLEKSKCQKMFFLDNDIVFKADDLIRLLAWSTKYPIVGATYCVRKDNPPTFFVDLDRTGTTLNEDGLLSCEGLGAGFVVIDRSVFEEMKPHTEVYVKDGETINRYFWTGVKNGKYRGEDIMFFKEWVNKHGGEIILDPCIDLQHVGHKYYDYKFSDWLKEQTPQ